MERGQFLDEGGDVERFDAGGESAGGRGAGRGAMHDEEAGMDGGHGVTEGMERRGHRR